MAVRSIVHVAAGALAGAVLIAAPTWAVASQSGAASSSGSDMAHVSSSSESKHQMMESMKSMSKMMEDPKLCQQMTSMMSDSMGEMSANMHGGMSGHDMSETG